MTVVEMTRTTFAISNVQAVLPDRVVDDATVVVEDGTVVGVAARGRSLRGAIDGRGALCLPGLVDTHSDGLEQELRPRPGVQLPFDFAMRSFEGRVRAAGVTTMFHGIGFEDDDRLGRSVPVANELCDAIERRSASNVDIVDHRILYRLDARDADGFHGLVERLTDVPPTAGVPLVSFEDHTPGQGQYADRRTFEDYLMATQGLTAAQARDDVDARITERAAMLANRNAALPWLRRAAQRGDITLLAHDPTTREDVLEAVTWHARIAEFPTTIEAAAAARELGLSIVCGAPNVLRGQSHSGNVSAAELIGRGLCDSLASDYMPSTLLGAVVTLVDRGTCGLPEAVRLVTGGPAGVVGLADRGRLEPGWRGDVVVVSIDGSWPTVRLVARVGDDGLVEGQS
jgi:alpha-D-ribose 1-methylphosphonate 5-triphosphate diphosphatase